MQSSDFEEYDFDPDKPMKCDLCNQELTQAEMLYHRFRVHWNWGEFKEECQT
jgi:hypothetical protein